MSGHTLRENGGTYSTGASDGHIWNVATGECSPLCPAAGGHSGSLLEPAPSKLELIAAAQRMRAEGLSLYLIATTLGVTKEWLREYAL